MKRTALALALAAATFLPTAYAQTSGTTTDRAPATQQKRAGDGATIVRVDVARVALGHRASKLVGATVVNSADESIGKIDDLVVNPQDKVTYAIVSVGGFLGVGSKLVAVPFELAGSGQGRAADAVGRHQGSAQGAAGVQVREVVSRWRRRAPRRPPPLRKEKPMGTNQIVGLLLVAVGIFLLVFGYNSSQAPMDQVSEAFTGRFRDSTMLYLVGGVIAMVAGGAVALAGRRA